MFWAIRGGTNWCREGDIGNEGVPWGTCSNHPNLWGPVLYERAHLSTGLGVKLVD